MKQFKFLFAVMLMITAMGFASCSDDDEEDATFKIVNNSGRDFYGIMMSPSSQTTWRDVLTDDTFPNGSSVTVTFNGSKDGQWDIRLFEDENDIDNGYVEFTNLNLTGRTKLTLTKKGDELWYELE
ncbi:MAG: hypothetical protein PUC50_17385 [Bacteroidales bacterium]|nr:hypothetical protein [Bacteroidales bacterium]MDD6003954.1 hypothetical protein [Bacteroidales bacterium]